MLAWGMLKFGEGNNQSDTGAWQLGLDTLRWNTDYLLKTCKKDADSSATSQADEFFIVYQVSFRVLERGIKAQAPTNVPFHFQRVCEVQRQTSFVLPPQFQDQ